MMHNDFQINNIFYKEDIESAKLNQDLQYYNEKERGGYSLLETGQDRNGYQYALYHRSKSFAEPDNVFYLLFYDALSDYDEIAIKISQTKAEGTLLEGDYFLMNGIEEINFKNGKKILKIIEPVSI